MAEKKIKILFANIPTPGNRFVVDLKEGLEVYADVTWDCESFWKMESHFDIIHIHWPEYLSFELEKYLYNGLSIPGDMWAKLETCLKHWSKNSKIIYTRHVQYPHARHDEDFLKLYYLTASYCQTVVHFANYSIQQFKEFYPDLTSIKHIVIPHHNYASLPNKISKEEARKKLQIANDARVMLVFGTINEWEKEIIKKAFNTISTKTKVLLAPSWKVPRRKISYIRLREWVWKFEKFIASKRKSFRTNLGFIEEEDAQIYLNAADILFIPRTNELNSGNITLGCTFGLVIIGKDGADIGEILIETGNPTFNPDNLNSLSEAFELAEELIKNKHGEKNRKLALENWGVDKISKMYFSEIETLLH